MAPTLCLSLLLFIVTIFTSPGHSSNPLSTCTNGRITYYSYKGNGMCGFGAIGGVTLPYLYIAAPNQDFYGDGSKCGVCYELTGPSGSMIVQVADMCPVSGNSVCVGDMDHFDLGPNSTTFAKVADSSWGNTLITKRQVACPVTGNVGVKTKDGVSASWMALLVFNHRVAVTMLQIQDGKSGEWHNMTRQPYNYWTYTPSSGIIAAPFNIKIFSLLGDVVSMSIPSLAAQQIYTANAQFSVPPAGFGGSTSGAQPCTGPATSPIIYDDALFKGNASSITWRDVSYGVLGSISWNYTVNPKVGSKCMQGTLSGYGAFQLLRSVPFNITSVFQALSFWGKVDGTTSFSKLKVMAEGGGSRTVTLTPTWTQFTLLLNASGLNAPSPFGGNSHKFQFQNNQATNSPTIYMDDIKLIPV